MPTRMSPGFTCCADADDAAFVQVAEELFADVWNIAGDFFRTELCIAGFDLELFDMDRSVVVFFDQLLADHDGVLEVVAAPGHERHQHVSAKCELAAIGARTVSNDLPFFTRWPGARSAAG